MGGKINDNGIYKDGELMIGMPTSLVDLDKVAAQAKNGVFVKPTSGVLFSKVSATTFTVPSGLVVKVGDAIVERTADITLNLDTDLVGSAKTAGTDYYVYLKADATLYISADKTITTDRLIGGFHYGLVAEAEAVTGAKTEADMAKIRGINAYSFWDLKFRPTCNPEGMVHIGGRWYDIYLLNSEHINNGTSKASGYIAGGDATYGRLIPKIPLAYGGDNTLTYGKFTWFQACEVAKSHGKELISYAEFPTIAYGVLEGKSSQTDGYESVAGAIEHYPELTSKYGIEQATGTQDIWGLDVNADANSGAWQDVTDSRGQIYANSNELNAVRLGGHRGVGASAGSRCSDWSVYVWNSSWVVGSRFACDHLELV